MQGNRAQASLCRAAGNGDLDEQYWRTLGRGSGPASLCPYCERARTPYELLLGEWRQRVFLRQDSHLGSRAKSSKARERGKGKAMTRKKAQMIVEANARKAAKKAGRKEPNILDRVPIVMTPEYLAIVRKAYGITP